MSVYQPAPGQSSTTVAPAFTPKKARVSAGWRKGSRLRSAALRHGPATAAGRVVGFSASAGASPRRSPGGVGLRPQAASVEARVSPSAAPPRASQARRDAPLRRSSDKLRLRLRLDEAQGHAVALADGVVLGVVEVRVG